MAPVTPILTRVVPPTGSATAGDAAARGAAAAAVAPGVLAAAGGLLAGATGAAWQATRTLQSRSRQVESSVRLNISFGSGGWPLPTSRCGGPGALSALSPDSTADGYHH